MPRAAAAGAVLCTAAAASAHADGRLTGTVTCGSDGVNKKTGWQKPCTDILFGHGSGLTGDNWGELIVAFDFGKTESLSGMQSDAPPFDQNCTVSTSDDGKQWVDRVSQTQLGSVRFSPVVDASHARFACPHTKASDGFHAQFFSGVLPPTPAPTPPPPTPAPPPKRPGVREFVSVDSSGKCGGGAMHGTWAFGACFSLAPYPDPFQPPYPGSVTASQHGDGAVAFALHHGDACSGSPYSTLTVPLDNCTQGPKGTGTWVQYELVTA